MHQKRFLFIKCKVFSLNGIYTLIATGQSGANGTAEARSDQLLSPAISCCARRPGPAAGPGRPEILAAGYAALGR